MNKNAIPSLFAIALMIISSPTFAGKSCKDGVTPKSSGCPLEFEEQLLAFDNFDTGVDGWSRPGFSDAVCGNDPMLILPANDGVVVSKNYDLLPEHNFVRVQATAYFVDDWQGNTAVLELDDQIVWTEQHDQRNSRGVLDVCGSTVIPEGKLGVPIDVTVPHTATSLIVGILSTLPGGAVAELAIDDVRISVFTYAP